MKERFKWRHASIGDLKSAYVAAFAMFGYLYAFEENLDLIREQISSPDIDVLPCVTWIGPRALPSKRVILGMKEPCRGLLVQLDRSFVGLPWGGKAEELYARAQRGFFP